MWILALLIMFVVAQARPYDTVSTWVDGWALPAKGEKSTIIRGATPGGREGAGVVEVDSRMYLYGGFALSSPIDNAPVAMGDLWLYDPAQGTWTWKHGVRDPLCTDEWKNQDQQNSSISPGPRVAPYIWNDGGFVTLFSGQPPSPRPFPPLALGPPLSDTWTFLANSPGQWVLEARVVGPTGRVAASTVHANGTFWMLGGYTSSPQDLLYELWGFKYSSWKRYWTSPVHTSVYPANQMSNVDANGIAVQPEIRHGASVFFVAGEVWYYGGRTQLNAEMWSFSGNWTFWASFTHDPVYPSVGDTCAGCNPGSRYSAVYFQNGSSLLVYGGYQLNSAGGEVLVDDQWRFDTVTKVWYFLGGSKLQQSPPNTNGISHRPQFSCEVDCWVYGGLNLLDAFSNEIQKVSNWTTTVEMPYTAGISPKFPHSVEQTDISPRAPSIKGGAMVIVNESVFIAFGEAGIPPGSALASSPGLDRPPTLSFYRSSYSSILIRITVITNDMWQFSKLSNTWRYVNVTSAPPARQYATMWTDKTHIWVFGGEGASGPTNDMWRFDIATYTWNAVSTADPWPVARSRVQADFDGVNLWMFGGRSNTMQLLNDLWIFDTARQSWQLISASSSGQPQGRSGGMACTDKESLWLYGGLSNSNGALSDFWHFEFTTRTWTLLSNGSYYPEYSNTSAYPGARAYGAIVCVADAVVLMGGVVANQTSFANDLWVYTSNSSWYWLDGSSNSPPSNFIYPNPFVDSILAGRGSASFALEGSRLWFFGGEGRADPSFPQNTVATADLWSIQIGKVTNSKSRVAYEWKKGITKQIPVQPQQTTAFPGARIGASLCDAGSGDLWLFGGIAVDNNRGTLDVKSGLVLGDLWRVAKDGTNWRWESGFYNSLPGYPDFGNTSVDGTPGSRIRSITWTQGDDLWLFGGVNGYGVIKNDIWRYNSRTKLWYGLGGQTSSGGKYPGNLNLNAHTFDQNGDLWIFGGGDFIYGSSQSYPTSEVWQLSRANLTWTQHSSTGTTTPASRKLINAVLWVDAGTACAWVWGGAQLPGQAAGGEMWRLNISDGSWSMSGSSGFTAPVYSQDKNTICTGCTPGSRASVMANWLSGTDLYLLGGTDTVAYVDYSNTSVPDTPIYNDLWRYSLVTNTWFWMGGDKGPQNQLSVNSSYPSPIPLSGSAMFVDPDTHIVSLFGGMDNDNKMHKEFLQYNMLTQTWKAIDGNSLTPLYPDAKYTSQVSPAPGSSAFSTMHVANGEVYLYGGTQGPTAWKLNPAGLSWEYLGTLPNASLFIPTIDDVSWVVGNKMYVFGGGFDYMQFYNARYYSNYVSSVLYSVDLDKNGSFTYLGGDANSKGQYSGNLWPGARRGSVGWVVENDLWLFGGYGVADDYWGSQRALDDLWRYNIVENKWYFINGDTTVYNTAHTTDRPTGRYNGALAATKTHMWHYGGFTLNDISSELWEYSTQTNSWTLLVNQPLKFPEQLGLGSPTYSPGPRGQCSMAYVNGSLFLFGGNRPYPLSVDGFVNTVWEYDLAEQAWYWLAGDSDSKFSYYFEDVSPLPPPANSPPMARTAQASAADSGGMWIYGGFSNTYYVGIPETQSQGSHLMVLQDLWYIKIDKDYYIPPENGTYLSTVATTITSSSSFSTSQATTGSNPTHTSTSPSTSFPTNYPSSQTSYTSQTSQTTQSSSLSSSSSSSSAPQTSHVANTGERSTTVSSKFLLLYTLLALLALLCFL